MCNLPSFFLWSGLHPNTRRYLGKNLILTNISPLPLFVISNVHTGNTDMIRKHLKLMFQDIHGSRHGSKKGGIVYKSVKVCTF